MTRDELKDKWEQTKIKAKWKVEDTKKWVNDHGDMILASTIIFGPMVLGILKEGVKQHEKKEMIREEKYRREQVIYDPSTGMYYETRRPMSPTERLEIGERHNEGEHYSSILHDMGLVNDRRKWRR